MYHPTTRLLTMLELLQTHPQISGDDLARRLEVEPRSVRRYITMLQEMGMPIEGTRGPGGGYRLRPGFKLPPLLFTEEEATAIVFGLLGAPWLEVELSSVAVEGALAKVYRVLPLRGRERLQAISQHMILSPHQQDARPDVNLLMSLSDAVQERRRIAISYVSHNNDKSKREVEPYGIVGWKGHWYIVGRCLLRQAPRLFRLDRISNVRFLNETFVREEDFDSHAYVVASLGTIPARWQVRIEFKAELFEVQRKVPSSHGDLSSTATGVLFSTHHNELTTLARYLVNLNIPFVVLDPPELRTTLLQLAEEIRSMALALPEE